MRYLINCQLFDSRFCILFVIRHSLMIKVRMQEEKHVELLEAGKQAKSKLEELVPEISETEKRGVYIDALCAINNQHSCER